ncbi:MAG: hypothetical protein EXR69_15370 [Myxococcales bacterium]|nr:hypothetical protein [Myxococcales bacterium]
MISSLLILLSGAPVAVAHVPHDEVIAVGAPRSLDPELSWILLAGSENYQIIQRSRDGGKHWEMVGGEPLEDTLIDVAVLDDGIWVAASRRRLWWSDDEGESWTFELALDEVVSIVGGAELWVVGRSRTWSERPGGVRDETPIGGAAVLGLSLDGPTAVSADGRVWLQLGGSRWRSIGGPADLAAVNRIGNTRFVGTRDGALHRADPGGSWSACGALPPEALGAHAVVAAIAASPVTRGDPDGVLLVVTGDGGPYRSRDGCESWQDLHGTLDTVYSGEGSAGSAQDAARSLFVRGGCWLQAGWAGLVVADEDGLIEPTLIPCDYTRGVVFSPGFGDDDTVLLGGYAAGVLRTSDAGVTWSDAGRGMDATNVQRVALPAAAQSTEVALAVVGHTGWMTHDGGDTWEALATPTSALTELFGVDNPAGKMVLWAFGVDGGDDVVAVSEDEGGSWSLEGPMNEALAGSSPAGLVYVQTPDGPAQVLLGSPSRVLYSFDLGQTWSQRYRDDEADAVNGPAGWPQRAPTRAVFSDSRGVHWSDDGLTWATVDDFNGAQIRQVEVAGNLVFAATSGGALWRSVDGAVTFQDLGLRTGAPVHTLRASPAFETTQLLLVGTHDGTFTLTDPSAVPTLVRWSQYQRIDDDSAYFACAACGDRVDDDRAGMGELRELGAGGVAKASLRGVQVQIFGTLARGGTAEVVVDGEHAADIGFDRSSVQARPDLLLTLDGLHDGWHDVEIRASSEGIAIDALSGAGPGVTSALAGCSSSGGAGQGTWAVLLSVWATWKRVGPGRRA